MERRRSSESETEKSMIDITFRMKENEMFADVKVYSFNLILSVDFLLKLSAFLNPATNLSNDEYENYIIDQKASESGSTARKQRTSVSNSQNQQVEKRAEFHIKIEEYDVILVEKMDDINCLALILNVSRFLI